MKIRPVKHSLLLLSSYYCIPCVWELMIGSYMSQWMDAVLAQGNEMTFFHDEFRCPVYVKDVVTIIKRLTNRWFSGLIYSTS